MCNQPLLVYLNTIISDGDDAHDFTALSKECIMYTAAWLQEEGFWQAASVLRGELSDNPSNESD